MNPNWGPRPPAPQNYYGRKFCLKSLFLLLFTLAPMYNPPPDNQYRPPNPYRMPHRPLQFFSAPNDVARIQRPRGPGIFNGPPVWDLRQPPPPQPQRPPAPLFPSGTRATAPIPGQNWSMVSFFPSILKYFWNYSQDMSGPRNLLHHHLLSQLG